MAAICHCCLQYRQRHARPYVQARETIEKRQGFLQAACAVSPHFVAA
jgi:hypothetical protein